MNRIDISTQNEMKPRILNLNFSSIFCYYYFTISYIISIPTSLWVGTIFKISILLYYTYQLHNSGIFILDL